MKKVGFFLAFFVAVFLLLVVGGLLESGGRTIQEPEYDTAMYTQQYTTQIKVLENGSYQIEEQIQVNMLEERHGIYRYIPQYGSSIYRDENKEQQKVPYFGKIKLLESNVPVETSTENGCTVFRLGSEEQTVYGPAEYTLRYQFTPWFQTDGYANAYYNVFPNMWQNPIPKGSTFSITFPKDFDHEALKLYAGSYESEQDGSEILKLNWSENTLTGELTEDLQLGEGITFFAAMPEGYFAGNHRLTWPVWAVLALTLAGGAAAALLFAAFGRDETIYPSIQYQPPKELDSASVGYIIDGVVENRDVLSLILYWADQGLLTIEEKEKGKLRLNRRASLPADAPAYAQTMFQKLFKDSDVCKIEKLSGKFYETISAVKEQIKMCYQGVNALYTKSSVWARRFCGLLCAVPFGSFLLLIGLTSYTNVLRWGLNLLCLTAYLAGVWTACYGVDTWHSQSEAKRWQILNISAALLCLGLAGYGGSYLQRVQNKDVFAYITLYLIVCAVSVEMALLTAFMRKRTHLCTKWMGKLLGLRDFIETAELERLNVLAEESPELFYHILPYAYVMGLSEVFAHKLKGLALEPPDWYTNASGRNNGYFDYYIFHHSLMHSMKTATQALAVPEPPKTSGGSGFSGGGFSGGGFSGGGFGGGGGGSW